MIIAPPDISILQIAKELEITESCAASPGARAEIIPDGMGHPVNVLEDRGDFLLGGFGFLFSLKPLGKNKRLYESRTCRPDSYNLSVKSVNFA